MKLHPVLCLCLQETKCPDDQFPHAFFLRHGFQHQLIRGEKGYNGVAILSRLPLEEVSREDFCGRQEARHLSALLTLPPYGQRIYLHNFYVPAGGYVAAATEEKFVHKLAFLEEICQFLSIQKNSFPMILLGDLNVAPYPNDVWSHTQMLKVVSHTPEETERLEALRATHDFIDTHRHFVSSEEKAYSWWSYRAQDWRRSNRGRRLDHIWASPCLRGQLDSLICLTAARGWDRPSDHVPLCLQLRGGED